MPASSGSPNSSKKLINLLLLMLVIALLFGAIVTLWVVSGDPSAGVNNSSTSDNSSRYDTATSINISGINRVSLLAALDRLNASGETASWLQAHPEWRLFQAQADYVDSQGLSRHWNVIIRSANSSLIAYVDNGIPFLAQIDETASGDSYRANGQTLQDSNYIVSNVTDMKGLVMDSNVTPFALSFYDDDGDGTYRVSYSNPADVSQSFVITYNARSGELVESP